MKIVKSILAGLSLAVMLTSCNEQQTVPTENGNAVIENIMSRRSIRKYLAKPIDREVLNTIMECGINAPNAINRQAWEVRVIDNKEAVAKFYEALQQGNPQAQANAIEGSFRGAPVLVIIANDTTFNYSPLDCGIMCENIMLSAWSMGVGSVCLGSPVGYIKNSPQAMQMLGFSENYEPLICIGLGYPDETPAAKPRDMGKVKFID
ncbi:MAG: nitroreductase family protein [Bacteroidaceae bacterium]|nr:nitroreductase family protein [Bacteroidaceae bacterium]